MKTEQKKFWLDLFTYDTWQEFVRNGCSISGFRKSRWRVVQKIKQGDLFLCYLTGVSRWIGLLEVTGDPFFDDKTPIWKIDTFPARLPVKPLITLEPINAVPILSMKEQLSIFENLKSPNAWTGAVRSSPSEWSKSDGEAVVAALREATRNPQERPFDIAKLAKTPPIFRTKSVGIVTIPDDEHEPSAKLVEQDFDDSSDFTQHLEIQYLLLKLGSDMGLDVWVAKNDRSRSFKGNKFSSINRIKNSLPLQFDEATNTTIEHIDVLWLKGKSISAAFEIESTTSIYSGLLRMSDLISMQPNLNIPLFLVAPDERRSKVQQEVNRPTFSRLSPPMTEMGRFIPFDALRERVKQAEAGGLVRYLRPEFLDEIAETCEIPEN